MKVLSLIAYFYPEQAASNYLDDNRNEDLTKAGCEIEVYTPMPCRGISDEVREKYRKRRVEKLYGGRMTVHRFPMYKEGKNPVLRALRYFLCCCMHYHYGVRAKDADVMFLASTPPIQGALGALVKKRRKIPFVYNLQDIFPDSLVGTGLAKRDGLLWKIGRKIEDFTYKHADKIIVISEDFKRNIMAKGVPEEKIEVVYNWVDENAVVDVSRDENLLFDKYNLDRSKFYLTYSGNIGLTQNMDLLLEVARDFQQPQGSHPALQNERPDGACGNDIDYSQIHFVLIGEGADKARVEEIVKRDNLTNVTMLPVQPYEDISKVFSLGDAGLVISKPGVGENSVPSKTWSIMSASRPVLANFDENELKTIIENNHCGIFTKAGDKESFEQAILQMYDDRERNKEMGRNGRQFIMQNLTRKIGTSKYVQVIKEVAGQ